MSRYEVALIRAGLVYLVLTGLLGLSFVFGVAYWLMPRPGGLRPEGLEALTLYLLNAGLVVRIIAEPLWRASGLESLRYALVASGVLQVAALLVFAFAMQARVKTKETILARRSGPKASE